jgi:hypothetical protein
MAENKSHVLSGLLEKRREITGKIEYTHRALNDLIADLDYIDNALRIIDPNYGLSLGRSKRYPPRLGAFKGEMSRFVLGHLRVAKEPATSLDIAYAVMKGRGLDTNDTRSVMVIRKRVSACLFKFKRKGLIREVAYTGEYKRWEMVRVT